MSVLAASGRAPRRDPDAPAAVTEAGGEAAGPAAGAEVGRILGALMSPRAARVVDKPWGREVWWAHTARYTGKLLEVRAGHRLSLQYHRMKMETLLFLCGAGELQVGEARLPIHAGMTVTIHPGEIHRVSAESDVVFMEVSSPEIEDVVRLEDRYGRVGAPAAPAERAV